MKVLVLSCSTGGGHNSCAKYIESEFKENNIECDFQNFLELIGEKTSKTVEKLYLGSTKGSGKVFKNIYKIGELYNKSKIKSPVYFFNKLAKTKLYNFIIENKYDLVICTHLFPSMTLTAINKKHRINFINVATDYECIPFWDETRPDYFVIPSTLLKERFIEKGVKENILLPIGIPVASSFTKAKDIKDLPTDKDIVLITSGSMGFGNMKELITKLLSEINNVYILVICGSNKKLEQEVLKINNKNLIVKGFVNNMKDYMKKSKIIITKPGGLTTTEVAILNKPLIHMMPIPGVENYNANFFENNKMSLQAKNIDEVVNKAQLLLNDKKLQKEMINNQKNIINKNSSKDLVEFVKKRYKKESD